MNWSIIILSASCMVVMPNINQDILFILFITVRFNMNVPYNYKRSCGFFIQVRRQLIVRIQASER